MPSLITVGHGTLGADAFAELLHGAGVVELVDIRSFPGSRAHPHMKREEMERWLPEKGIGYRWDNRLGGRRRLREKSLDPWWQVEAFRAYAAWTRTPEWHDGFAQLCDQVTRERTAICCSEAVWWRCHRRLVADVACLTTDLEVLDLMHDSRLGPHPPAAGARVVDGQVFWDLIAP